jgi:hypothetical protein
MKITKLRKVIQKRKLIVIVSINIYCIFHWRYIIDFIYVFDHDINLYILVADNTNSLPLMEGEGNSLKVLGFTQSQRNTFFQILMRLHSSYWFMIKEGFFMEIFAVNLIWLINNRFGVGDFNWTEFAPRIKQKTWHEINAYVIIWFFINMSHLKSLFASKFDLYILNRYGNLFLSHIAEDINDSPTFSGVRYIPYSCHISQYHLSFIFR